MSNSSVRPLVIAQTQYDHTSEQAKIRKSPLAMLSPGTHQLRSWKRRNTAAQRRKYQYVKIEHRTSPLTSTCNQQSLSNTDELIVNWCFTFIFIIFGRDGFVCVKTSVFYIDWQYWWISSSFIVFHVCQENTLEWNKIKPFFLRFSWSFDPELKSNNGLVNQGQSHWAMAWTLLRESTGLTIAWRHFHVLSKSDEHANLIAKLIIEKKSHSVRVEKFEHGPRSSSLKRSYTGPDTV